MIQATCKKQGNSFVGQCKIEGSKKELYVELRAILSSFVTDKEIIIILADAMSDVEDLLEEGDTK